MKCKTTAIKLLKLKLTDVFSRTHNKFFVDATFCLVKIGFEKRGTNTK